MCFKGSFSSNVVHYLVLLLLRQSWTYIFFKLRKFYLYINNVCFEVDPVMMIWITAVKTLDNCRQHTEKLIILKGCLHELILCAKLLSLCLTNICVCSWTECCRRHGEQKTQAPYAVFLQTAQSPGQGQLSHMPAGCQTRSAGPHVVMEKTPLSWSRRHLVGVLREQTGVRRHGQCEGGRAEPQVSLRWTLVACW